MSDPYIYEPHKPRKRGNITWMVCDGCGLVYLNNEFTRWSIKKGCNYQDSPQFEDARKRFTGFK